ncbi:GAF and ANTAR domain-containing protein [Amycolatopsis sp. DSM 110486]|uniref:GAF and ANTAR domain-containing protein n=1 Tax=Amycolatopsis sp. DSM 110486 TaxID=2865832 RepID=UPI002102A59A|nr:GAF and ANTAR domain-containing protein [Amycolatopsis sp. DSM 110486]
MEKTPRDWLRRASRTFVSLADTLADGFDVADFLQMLAERCVDLLGVSAVGVMLLDADGHLQVVASSSRRRALPELFAAQTVAGPCFDCVDSGSPVRCADISAEADRWPQFTAAAAQCGLRAEQALPMRLRDQVVGVLALLSTEPGDAARDDIELGQSLADVATIGLLQHWTIERANRLTGQLQTALTSRVVIEQAKGVLATYGAVSMDEAFRRLRGYARARQLRLADLSRAVAGGAADLASILAHS